MCGSPCFRGLKSLCRRMKRARPETFRAGCGKLSGGHKSFRGECCKYLRKFPQATQVRGACGSFRKLTQVCGAFAEVSASSLKCAGRLRKFPQAHSSVRALAEVSASSLKCAGRLRKFPQASRKCAGHLRKFPQANSNVRGVCGSFRKLLASVRGICGSFRKPTQVCGAFAEVSASHSNVRHACGSFRKLPTIARHASGWCRKSPPMPRMMVMTTRISVSESREWITRSFFFKFALL